MQRFDTPPVFNSEERKRFFNLPRAMESSLKTLRSVENQILFILQFGYYPTGIGQNGERKQIRVRVNRPNLVIRARDSYIVGAAAK